VREHRRGLGPITPNKEKVMTESNVADVAVSRNLLSSVRRRWSDDEVFALVGTAYLMGAAFNDAALEAQLGVRAKRWIGAVESALRFAPAAARPRAIQAVLAESARIGRRYDKICREEARARKRAGQAA
jgi:hypothetical protein